MLRRNERRTRLVLSILSRAAGALLPALLLGAPAIGDTQGSSPTGSVDPFSGSFTTDVPITAPDFRGLTPGLRLIYNSSGGNGWVGVGWSLSGISSIYRRGPNDGMPTYGPTDKFFLDGAELVPCATQQGTHCTYIQNYARIVDEGDGTWTIRGTNGYLATYEPLVAIGSNPDDTYRWGITSIEDPNGNQIFFDYWCDGGTYPDDCYPDSIAYGGGAEILFHSELRPDVIKAGNGASFTTSRYRLKSIEVRAGSPQETVRVYEVTYAQSAESGRSLVASVQQFGRGTEVLANGSVNSEAWPPPPSIPPMTFAFPSTGTFPADGGAGSFLIPCNPASIPPGDPAGCPVVSSIRDDPASHVREKSAFGDFNGDGRMDSLVWVPGGIYVPPKFYVALASGTPEAPSMQITEWTQPPTTDGCLELEHPVQSFTAVDVNADGRADIVQLCSDDGVSVQIEIHSWINQLNGTFTRVSTFVPEISTPTEPADFDIDLSTRMPVDVDGDGKVDIVVIERKPNGGGDVRVRVGRGNGDGTFTWTHGDYSGLFWSSDLDNHIVWTPGDFNGDGRTDFASFYEHPGTNTIYAQFALANAGLTFSTGQQPTGLSNYNNATWSPVRMSVTPADMNGDGLTDVTAVVDIDAGPTRLKVDVIALLSRGGGGALFEVDRDTVLDMSRSSEPYAFLHPTVAVGDLSADGISEVVLEYYTYDHPTHVLTLFRRSDGSYSVRETQGSLGPGSFLRTNATAIADSSGDGVGDLMMIRQHDWWAGQPRYTSFGSYVSLAEVDLLDTLDNGIGGTSQIEYVPSAEWLTANPLVDQYLPPGFSTPTVVAVTTSDGRGSSGTATYTYEGALWSLAERQFMGYRRVGTVVDGTGSTQETVYYQLEGTIAKPEQTTVYDSAGNIISASRHVYTDDDDDLPPFTSLLGERWDYECNGATSLEGCRVVLTQFGYDIYGNVIETKEHGVYPNEGVGLGDERTTVRVYGLDPSVDPDSYIVGLPLKETIYKGLDTSTMFPNAQQQTSWDYDAHGNRISEAQLVNYTPTAYWRFWQYDGDGNVIWENDFLGAVTTTVYDPTFNLFPIHRCNALSHCSSYAWDTVIGQRTSHTDPNGLGLEYEYDGMGRLSVVTRSDGGATTFYTHLETAEGSIVGKLQGVYGTFIHYDGLGREYKRTREGDATKVTIYQNTLTRPWKESLWFGPEQTEETAPYIEYSYDAAGRPRIVKNADETESETQYGLGFRDVIDELDHKRRIWTDGLGRVTQVREYEGSNELETTYSYDAVDRLIQSVDHLGHVSQHLWSLVGQKIISCTPGTGCWLYGYNAPGLVTTQIDARNQAVTYTYDALGRIKTKNVPGVGASTWFYDEPNHGAAVGRVTRITFPGGSESYNYDLAGNNTVTSRCVDAVCKTTSAMYDASDRPWLIQYPDSQQVLYAYDANGRLASVGGWAFGVGGPVYVSAMEWSAAGKLKSITHGNGAVSTYEYDEEREWLDEATVKNGSGATLYHGVYEYDVAARVDSMEVTRQFPGAEQWDYEYDALNRLTSLLATNAPDEDYQYDEVGNMKRKGSPSSPLYEYNDPTKPFAVTRIGTSKYTYDAVGNRTAKGTCNQAECTTSTTQETYAFDADGRMTSFTNVALGQTTTYGYGPGEERVRISGPGGTRRIFGELYETTDSAGNAGVSYIYAGPIRVAMKDASGTYYYHHDHLGSVRVITNQAGAVVATNDFMPFGERVNGTGSAGSNPYDFAGHRTDVESGLVYMKARYYDPQIARFISPDRIVPDVMNPQSLNPYAYANNNPISNVDPTGHSPQGLIMFFSLMLSIFNPNMTPMLAAVVLVGTQMTVAGMALQNPVLSSLGSIMLGFVGGYMLEDGGTKFGGIMGASAAGLSSPASPLSTQAKMAVAWTWTANCIVKATMRYYQRQAQALEQQVAIASANDSQVGEKVRADDVLLTGGGGDIDGTPVDRLSGAQWTDIGEASNRMFREIKDLNVQQFAERFNAQEMLDWVLGEEELLIHKQQMLDDLREMSVSAVRRSISSNLRAVQNQVTEEVLLAPLGFFGKSGRILQWGYSLSAFSHSGRGVATATCAIGAGCGVTHSWTH